MAYVVTSMDICVQGYERLRNQDEFLLAAAVGPADADGLENLIQEFKNDVQSFDRDDGADGEPFDYPEAERVVEHFIKANSLEIAKQLRNLDELDEDEVENSPNWSGCHMFIYISTNG